MIGLPRSAAADPTTEWGTRTQGLAPRPQIGTGGLGLGATHEKFGDKNDLFLVLYKKNKLRSIKEYIKY